MAAKIRKGTPTPHVVIPDTSILWHKDKALAVTPDFDVFWNEHSPHVQLELVVPSVVRGELLFQQCTSASKSLQQANEHLSKACQVIDASYPTKLTPEKIRQHTEEKVDAWIASLKGRVAPTPFAAIDWQRLCEAAVWREAPFEMDAKNSENEKGFRDALILETVLDVSKQDQRQVNIAFLCNDSLLRTTAAQRLKGDVRFACYESVGDFASYLKLTREKLDKEFIKQIVLRAAEKFYTKDDPNCLWLKERMWERIPKEQEERLKLDSETLGWLWEAEGPHHWRVSGPEFQKITPERTYHWKTVVTYYRRYSSRTVSNVNYISAGLPVTYPTVSNVNYISGGLLPVTYHSPVTSARTSYEDNVLCVGFDVLWKANVKADARFHDITLEGINPGSKEFRAITPQERQRYWPDSAAQATSA